MASPQYLLAVNHVVGNLVKAVDILRQRPDLSGLRTVLITNQSDAYEKYAKFINQEDIVICDFNNQEDIKEKLLPL